MAYPIFNILHCLPDYNFFSTITDSYSSDSVAGQTNVGGLAGCNRGTMSNSYSTGSVTGNTYVGGLTGRNAGTVSNSFWDTETSGQATSAGGTGKNTTEMQNITTFSGVGWNIIAVLNTTMRDPLYIWNIVNNVTYPSPQARLRESVLSAIKSMR